MKNLCQIFLHPCAALVKRCILILSVLAVCSPIWADESYRKQPLQFVPADSVYTWGYDGNDFRAAAMRVSPAVSAPSFNMLPSSREKRSALARQCVQILQGMNWAGGMGRWLSEPQGLSGVTNLRAAAALFLLTGDARYADAYERTLYNALPHTLADSTLAMRDREKQVAAANLFMAPSLLYATAGPDAPDLYINLYTNSTATLQVGGRRVVVDQITEMPADGQVKIRFTQMKGLTPLRVHLRMPDWTGLHPASRGQINALAPSAPLYIFPADTVLPRVYVNGHEVFPLEPDEYGYVVIDREWRNMNEIYIDFPLPATFLLPAATPRNEWYAPRREEARWQRGPVVYLPDSIPANGYFSSKERLKPTADNDARGLPVLQGVRYECDGNVQDKSAQNHPFRAVAY